MQKIAVFGAIIALSGSLFAADSTSKDHVLNAAKKLGDQASYSWKTTVEVPESSRFRPGPTEGKTEKDGFTLVSMTVGNNTVQAAIKGDKSALRTEEGWQSLSEMDTTEGRGRWTAMMLRNIKLPAVQAAELVAGARDFKKEGDAYTAELSEEAVKSLLAFRARGGGDGPAVTHPKGSVKFWTQDGVLTKYVVDAKGTMNFNDNDVQMDRTTTVELKDIGTTKVDVPAEAKKKLS